ncbi:HNH endonuclease signature motif containing protein [Bartonella tamiae]|uniref:HNH endonuclease signature motif containing protein n=1 Tax=Bartonella tamiae TaxID=373638 RepID=UPI0009D9EFDB|nr:HNH endonuclease signature motif containing protein [Bartonella tamiae]
MFTCAICAKLEHNTSQLVCDHIKPHRGNEAMFWDITNMQCLCKHCHDSVKQQIEKRMQ